MSERTLFLAWQDKARTKAWFPIGRLDVYEEAPKYRFQYIAGVKRARSEAGFPTLWDFPDIEKEYCSPRIFPLFKNRIMSPRRPDFADYMSSLDLSENAEPFDILSVNDGYRATDNFQVFPKLVKGDDGHFVCRFFLHGWRHTNDAAQERLDRLALGEELRLSVELNNPATTLAIQVQTTDYHMIGWAPRYLVHNLATAMSESPGNYEAKVVHVPHKSDRTGQRALIEMRGRWDKHEPMSGPDYQPLVSD